jgi:hypothetical protein
VFTGVGDSGAKACPGWIAIQQKIPLIGKRSEDTLTKTISRFIAHCYSTEALSHDAESTK